MGLTRSRLHLAIYFVLHRGSLRKTLQEVNHDSTEKPAPEISVKNYMSYKRRCPNECRPPQAVIV